MKNGFVKAGLKLEEARAALGKHLDIDYESRNAETWDTELATLKTGIEARSAEFQAAAALEESTTTTKTANAPSDPEQRELLELRNRVDFGQYVKAAMAGHGVVGGAEAEYNQHLGMASEYFPMSLLSKGLEERAKRDGDAQGNQMTWLDRVFAGSAADALGVSFRTVAPGVAAYPVTTAGGTPAQRGRTEAAAEGTYTVDVTEIKPTRNAVHGIYSIEDNMRLPGLAGAIERDMRMAVTEKVDRTVFVGDSGANENTADIAGFTTAAITEATLTQTNKIKGAETLAEFVKMIDGKHAMTPADLMVVSAVGANTLWRSTIFNDAADNQTLAQFLMANGIHWTTRGDIEANSLNNDFAAFVGRARGIEGSAIAAVWDAGELIRDHYTSAAAGETKLTLNYLWGFAIPRTANYQRLKFVT